MHLNQSLRQDIIKHVNEVFFPQEVDETVLNSLRQLFMDYITSSYGSMHPFVRPTMAPRWLFLTPMDGILDPRRHDGLHFRKLLEEGFRGGALPQLRRKEALQFEGVPSE